MLRLLIMILVFPTVVFAQSEPDPEALAEIRSELTQLYAEISSLREELSKPVAGASATQSTGPALVRLDAMEAQLRKLTGNVEQLRFRISQVVEDGTRRIGDLEFRLVELEGGDISALGDTPTLGGQAENTQMASIVPVQPQNDGTVDDAPELAFAEQSDFEQAAQSLGDGDFANAVMQFGQFLTNYPGGPLSAQAYYHLGEAQEAMGQHKEAARSYLDSFTAQPTGNYAPQALMRVGVALGTLGRVDKACQTLNEVIVRYPESEVVDATRNNQQQLGCI